MEASYIDVLRSARIVDLQDSSATTLPDTNQLVALGLTVDDRLSCTVEGDAEDDLVLTLCSIQRKNDGHWCFPHIYLPCHVNDAEVHDITLLSQGSVITIGDRWLRYALPLETRLRVPTDAKTSQVDGPPPKPKRTPGGGGPRHKQYLTDTITEDQFEEDVVTDNGRVDVSGTSNDEELLRHLQTPDEVSQLASSYVGHQVAIYTDLLLSTDELDFLFKAIQECGQTCQQSMYDFVVKYNAEQKTNMEESKSGGFWPLHGPVIFLLGELLRNSLEPPEHTVLWLKLLHTFSNFSPNLPSFLHYKVAPVVMGAMAAHALSSSVQQFGSSVLAQLATCIPTIGQKGPVRESGVDLMVRALRNHTNDTLVLRPALRTLANITETYSKVADLALSIGRSTPAIGPDSEAVDVLLKEVERSMGILDFVEEQTLPVVLETMEQHLCDLGVQTEGRRMLAFFVDDECGVKASRRTSMNTMVTNSSEPQKTVRFQLDPDNPNVILSTRDDTPSSSEDEEEHSRRIPQPNVTLKRSYFTGNGATEYSLANSPTLGEIPQSVPEEAQGSSKGGTDENHVEKDETGVAENVVSVITRTGGSSSSLAVPGETLEIPKIYYHSVPMENESGGEIDPCRNHAEKGETRVAENVVSVITRTGGSSSSLAVSGETLEIPKISYHSVPMENESGCEIDIRKLENQSEFSGSRPVSGELAAASVQSSSVSGEHIAQEGTTKKDQQERSNVGNTEADSTEMHGAIDEEVGTTAVAVRVKRSQKQHPRHKEKAELSEMGVPETDARKKSNSLMRRVDRMVRTGRAMDRAIRSGRSRMLHKVKKRLKFKDLKEKEEHLTGEVGVMRTLSQDSNEESNSELKGRPTDVVNESPTSTGVRQLVGGDVCRPTSDRDQLHEIDARFILGGITTHGLLEGVTLDSSSTDPRPAISDTSGGHPDEDVNESLSASDCPKSPPPLFVPTSPPVVTGSVKTINNLIGLWKDKEKAASDTETNTKPQKRHRMRGTWRPFEDPPLTVVANSSRISHQIPESNSLATSVRETQVDNEGSLSSNQEKSARVADVDTSVDIDLGQADQTSTGMNVCDDTDGHDSEKTLGSRPRMEPANPSDVTMADGQILGPVRPGWTNMPHVSDVERLLATPRPTLTDSMELATWLSSYNSSTSGGGEFEDVIPEFEQEVRVNRTKWKSIVAELKDTFKRRALLFDVYQGPTTGGNDGKDCELMESEPFHSPSEIITNPSENMTDDHEYLCNVLAARTLILRHILERYRIAPTQAARLLTRPAGELLVAAGAFPSLVTGIKQTIPLLVPFQQADPEMAAQIIQVLADTPSSYDVVLEMLSSITQLMTLSHNPYHVTQATACATSLITGPLAMTYNTGKGVTVMRGLQTQLSHLMGSNRPDYDPSLLSSLSDLHHCIDTHILGARL